MLVVDILLSSVMGAVLAVDARKWNAGRRSRRSRLPVSTLYDLCRVGPKCRRIAASSRTFEVVQRCLIVLIIGSSEIVSSVQSYLEMLVSVHSPATFCSTASAPCILQELRPHEIEICALLFQLVGILTTVKRHSLLDLLQPCEEGGSRANEQTRLVTGSLIRAAAPMRLSKYRLHSNELRDWLWSCPMATRKLFGASAMARGTQATSAASVLLRSSRDLCDGRDPREFL